MVKFNIGEGAAGAATGAGIGSFAGPVGTAVGGAVGAGLGLMGGGSENKIKQVQNYTPDQMQLIEKMYFDLTGGKLGEANEMSMDYFLDLLNPSGEAFEKFAAPYMQEFEQKTIPGIAERFAGAGSESGALSSSGFGQALSSAGGNLQTQLASLRAELMGQAAQHIGQRYQNTSGQVLGAQPYSTVEKKGQQGAGTSALQSYLAGGAQGAEKGLTNLGNYWDAPKSGVLKRQV